MSIKEDLKAVKEELNTEEQFLEGLIKAERFYKKYKKPIIAIVSIVIVAFVAYSINTYIQERDLKISNEAYLRLLSNPNDKEAAKLLKEKNINLYYAYRLQVGSKKNDLDILNDVKSNAKDRYLSDLADYQKSSLKKKGSDIDNYIGNSKEGLLKNFALLEEAYLLLKEKKYQQAKLKLSLIEVDSPIKDFAQNLEYFIKK